MFIYSLFKPALFYAKRKQNYNKSYSYSKSIDITLIVLFDKIFGISIIYPFLIVKNDLHHIIFIKHLF